MTGTTVLDTASEINSKLFIAKRAHQFELHLQQLDDHAKHMIQSNQQLNNLYDLFLDFIIDAHQHVQKNLD